MLHFHHSLQGVEWMEMLEVRMVQGLLEVLEGMGRWGGWDRPLAREDGIMTASCRTILNAA